MDGWYSCCLHFYRYTKERYCSKNIHTDFMVGPYILPFSIVYPSFTKKTPTSQQLLVTFSFTLLPCCCVYAAAVCDCWLKLVFCWFPVMMILIMTRMTKDSRNVRNVFSCMSFLMCLYRRCSHSTLVCIREHFYMTCLLPYIITLRVQLAVLALVLLQYHHYHYADDES